MARRTILLAAFASALVVAGTAALFACSQTPISVPVRTFERAQRMDVACVQLYDPQTFAPREPIGRPVDECAPVPSDLDGDAFGKQLYAFVTQTTRGEVAVVNLSAGRLIDQSRATPGINFLPVGALPTDVATTPDGKMVFVASAEVNKAAIYGIPTRRLLGDTDDRFPREAEPASIASWPVCALPQSPSALAVIPRRGAGTAGGPSGAAAADGGAAAADGGAAAADGGAPADLPDYELVVVLPGDRQASAKIVTIDPRPFRRGSLARKPDGTPDYDSDHLQGEPPSLTDGPILQPGSLAPCPILGAIELAGADAVPASFVPGAAWDTGVKYVDGGVVDLRCKTPTRAPNCGPAPCCGQETLPPADAGDAGAPGPDAAAEAGAAPVDAGACEPLAAAPDAGPVPLDFGPLDPPRLVSVVRDGQLLYVADEGVPFIHVLDMSTPGAPRELPPLLATSLVDPARVVKIKELAISPPTRDYKRFLYAIDRVDGSIMVYDVTDPQTMQRSPLTRPNPELNPFQPPDRIAFSSPVVSVAFARHDVPLAQQNGVRIASAGSGVLCNPNPAIDANAAIFANPNADLGYFYRPGSTDPGQDIGPRRLRGVFAFATLSNGQVLTIDVDDWDSPCRRPFDMSTPASDVAPAEPAVGDADPYHAPVVADQSVTNEAFFPMSLPHSFRSEVIVRDDSTAGNQLPRLQGAPTVSLSGIILPQTGPEAQKTPLLDVRFSFEDPHAHIDQDWAVTYEGALPGFEGVTAELSTEDAYASVVMKQPSAHFCAKGVEDWARGMDRTEAIARETVKRGATPVARADRMMTDYVRLTEELLDPSDGYWTLPQDCWDPSLAPGPARQDACYRTFGAVADDSPQRDFPIVEAYDDKVVLGRFYTTDKRREVVYKDASNAPTLRLLKCCFHNQARFNVRAGRLWTAVGRGAGGGGGGVGFFSHLTTDAAGRCVPSCDPRDALLNGRVPTTPNGVVVDLGAQRNSALAMRNPMFAMSILGGASGDDPARDTQYTFSTRGQFRALYVSIGGSSISVNPQSMRYVEPLGQMAIVDGASQGLTLIDLRAVTVARAPYF